MIKNKKGFVIIKLLLTIIPMCTLMLSITSVFNNISITGDLSSEGKQLVDAARTAYQAEQLMPNSKINSTSTVCFDLEWLSQEGYFYKDNNNYYGSVLIKYQDGAYTLKYWLTDGKKSIKNADVNGIYSKVDNIHVFDSIQLGMNNCDNARYDIFCTIDPSSRNLHCK